MIKFKRGMPSRAMVQLAKQQSKPLKPKKAAKVKVVAAAPAPKFRVGQVVHIIADLYSRKGNLFHERYQRITDVWDWDIHDANTPAFGYTFMNGDECNEKWIVGLTKKERGE